MCSYKIRDPQNEMSQLQFLQEIIQITSVKANCGRSILNKLNLMAAIIKVLRSMFPIKGTVAKTLLFQSEKTGNPENSA